MKELSKYLEGVLDKLAPILELLLNSPTGAFFLGSVFGTTLMVLAFKMASGDRKALLSLQNERIRHLEGQIDVLSRRLHSGGASSGMVDENRDIKEERATR